MNAEVAPAERNGMLFLWVGILGTFLIMAALVWCMHAYTRPAPVNASRVEERKKALAEVNGQAREQLDNYGWADQSKGLVRLPIAQAMELTVRNWKNPAAARSNLIARLPKAPPPAAKQPEKPSPYE